MKKIVGIYCGNLTDGTWDEETVLKNGGGGSETWAVETAREFQRRGFHVIVFGNPDRWKFSLSGVEYVPFQMFNSRIQYQKFDYFISSRQAAEITQELSCPNVYLMAHDVCFHYAGTVSDLKLDRVKKIGYLSDYHKWCLSDWYKYEIPDDKFLKVSNGVDETLYNDVDSFVKKNKMVWSSRSERGLTYFLDWVAPKIKDKIPDFEIDVCLYLEEMKREDRDWVHFLGKIGKEELAERQMESKIWIYPNIGFLDTNGSPFQETYCITAVENGMAKNAILTTPSGGLKTTLNGYKGFIGQELIDENEVISGSEKLLKYADIIADKAVKILKDETCRNYLAENAYMISKEHTWKNSVDIWIEEFGLNYLI